MNNLRPAFEALTVNLVGQTITLRSDKTNVTGLLTGLHIEGWATRTYDGTTTVEDVSVSVRFDRHGGDWDVLVTSDMTLEIKEDDQ